MTRMNLEDWEELTEERRKEAIANKKAKAPAATPEERRQAKRDADKRYREKLAKAAAVPAPADDNPFHPESPEGRAMEEADSPAALLDDMGRAIGCALHQEPHAPSAPPAAPTAADFDYGWDDPISAAVPEIPLRPTKSLPAIEVNFTRTEWAGRINRFWREGRESAVAAIIMAGENLAASRSNMESDEWRAMIEHDLDMGRNTAQRLVIIGASKRIKQHKSQLPASWMTLYELTKLSDADFEALVQNGILRPEMERKEIAKALPPPAAQKKDEAEGCFTAHHAPDDYGDGMDASQKAHMAQELEEDIEPAEPSEAMIAAGVRALNEWGSFHPNNAKKIARDIYMAMTMVRA